MSFTDKQVTVGLGSFDVSVDRVWVVSPTHLIANVTVASGAALGASEASVITGFQAASQKLALQTLPANPAQPSVLSVVNRPTISQSPRWRRMWRHHALSLPLLHETRTRFMQAS